MFHDHDSCIDLLTSHIVSLVIFTDIVNFFHQNQASVITFFFSSEQDISNYLADNSLTSYKTQSLDLTPVPPRNSCILFITCIVLIITWIFCHYHLFEMIELCIFIFYILLIYTLAITRSRTQCDLNHHHTTSLVADFLGNFLGEQASQAPWQIVHRLNGGACIFHEICRPSGVLFLAFPTFSELPGFSIALDL